MHLFFVPFVLTIIMIPFVLVLVGLSYYWGSKSLDDFLSRKVEEHRQNKIHTKGPDYQ
jgi:hypothetical protein